MSLRKIYHDLHGYRGGEVIRAGECIEMSDEEYADMQAHCPSMFVSNSTATETPTRKSTREIEIIEEPDHE